MAFRIYILLILASVLLLLNNLLALGSLILFWLLFIAPIKSILQYKKWKHSQAHVEKSLSFGIKSMKIQKQNFKSINFLFSKIPFLETLFKKISILIDDIHIKYTSDGVGNTYADNSILENKDDIIFDPSYSSCACNVHYRDN